MTSAIGTVRAALKLMSISAYQARLYAGLRVWVDGAIRQSVNHRQAIDGLYQ